MKGKRLALKAGRLSGTRDKETVSRSSSSSSLKAFKDLICHTFKLGESKAEQCISEVVDDGGNFKSRLCDGSTTGLNDYDTPFCIPGPSSASKQRQYEKSTNINSGRTDAYQRHKRTPSVTTVCSEAKEDDEMEPVFLPENSPLKGKEKVFWRSKKLDPVQMPAESLVSPVPAKMLEIFHRKEQVPLPRKHPQCYVATEFRIHAKGNGDDHTQDIVFRVPKLQLKENG
jgi:hypothetical protein